MQLSVVIPTHGRAETLLRTLGYYAALAPRAPAFEVIVVDDASPDATRDRLTAVAGSLPYPLVTLFQRHNTGPAAARNRALAVARGAVVVFVGDDILPDAGFMIRHHAWHARHPAPGDAMVGRVRWAPGMGPPALLSWLERAGVQFQYGAMTDGAEVGPARFYTSNASVKAAFLARTGARFNPALRFCEDSDFALRLAQEGLRVWYDAGAQAVHLHPTTLASSLARMRALGAAAAVMEGCAPATFARITAGLFDARHLRARLARAAVSEGLTRALWSPLAHLCAARIGGDRVFALAHAGAFRAGYRAARATPTPASATPDGEPA